jgi:hypothetical protein
MSRKRVPVVWAMAFGMLGLMACENQDDRRSRPPSASIKAPVALAAVSQNIAFRRHAMARRLQADPVLPKRYREQACPDDRLRQLALEPAAHTLVLRTYDARVGAKHLLPLDLLRRLETGEMRKIDGGFNQPPELGGKIASDAAARQVLGALDEARQRRFRGVYHIVEYAPPALIRRVGRMRSEWVPGWLVAWLAIEDLDRQELLCQTRVLVRSDVRDEPVTRRTKSEVKQRLIGELAGSLRSDSQPALQRISSILRLPAS